MRVTIDTDILVRAWREFSMAHINCVTMLYPDEEGEKPTFYLCYDNEEKILDEYESVLGSLPSYRHWISELHRNQILSQVSGQLKKKHQIQLSKLGCHKPSKQLFVAVAFNSELFLISENSDFGKGAKGYLPPHCDAYQYLTEEMGLTICDAQEARKELRVLRELLDSLADDPTRFSALLARNTEQVLDVLAKSPDLLLDLLAQNPERLLKVLTEKGMVALFKPELRGQLLGYLFEEKIRVYLQDEGYIAERGKTFRGFEGDIDVYAERGNEILICECYMPETPDKPIRAEKVKQIIARFKFICAQKPTYSIKAWLVSPSNRLEDEINQWKALESYPSIEVMHFRVRNKVFRFMNDDKLAALWDKDWFMKDRKYEKVSPPS